MILLHMDFLGPRSFSNVTNQKVFRECLSKHSTKTTPQFNWHCHSLLWQPLEMKKSRCVFLLKSWWLSFDLRATHTQKEERAHIYTSCCWDEYVSPPLSLLFVATVSRLTGSGHECRTTRRQSILRRSAVVLINFFLGSFFIGTLN